MVLQRSLVLTLHVVNTPEVSIALGHVRVVLAGNFDEDLESLLVVLQRSLVLTLAVVNIPEA